MDDNTTKARDNNIKLEQLLVWMQCNYLLGCNARVRTYTNLNMQRLPIENMEMTMPCYYHSK
jgi:hypothetical protein